MIRKLACTFENNIINEGKTLSAFNTHFTTKKALKRINTGHIMNNSVMKIFRFM